MHRVRGAHHQLERVACRGRLQGPATVMDTRFFVFTHAGSNQVNDGCWELCNLAMIVTVRVHKRQLEPPVTSVTKHGTTKVAASSVGTSPG